MFRKRGRGREGWGEKGGDGGYEGDSTTSRSCHIDIARIMNICAPPMQKEIQQEMELNIKALIQKMIAGKHNGYITHVDNQTPL